MAKRKNGNLRKRRTREHIIADLGINHVERFSLLAGHAVDRIQHDYGLDLMVFTYTARGEIENGNYWVQVKATAKLRLRLVDP